MLVNERIQVDQSIRRFLMKPEFVVPLTFHFHLVKNDGKLTALFYPSEKPQEFSIFEFHQKFLVNLNLSFNEYLYTFNNNKGIIYRIRFIGTSGFRNLDISVEVERNGPMKRLPITEDHLLQHVVANLRQVAD
ncbi:hypothetical protein [Metallosphaera javensis (ex Hofmann et al. 2022)]|uniref:hypothetical protein n=1 Tax=Metallosphaera javensis (ex Hofmann et al. 2022) TaxID=99938 RepID=UPI001EDF2BE8|nr:hypothetical protein [Metallosphaera javensis (ex Hofmann et al. 2022)]